MQIPLAAALIGFVIAFAVSRWMLHWSPKLGLLDMPEDRKPHSEATPLGGLAVSIATFFSVILISPLELSTIGWIIGASGMAAIGLYDDRFNLSPVLKLTGQLLFALLMILISGFMTTSLNLFGTEVALGIFAIPFTLIWLVGITNAINLIDGLDGVAIGAVTIASATLLIFNLASGNLLGIVLSAALIGSGLGFFLFNIHPAKLFLGDGGSYFLGFSIAVLSLGSFTTNWGELSLVPLGIVVILLLYPISDTLWAIVRRTLARRSIFSPDQQHLHHQLIGLKLNYYVAVGILYSSFALFALLALFLASA